MKLNIDMDSPVFVLPFQTDGSLLNECWVFYFGNLLVNSLENVLKPNLPFELKAVDMFHIQL